MRETKELEGHRLTQQGTSRDINIVREQIIGVIIKAVQARFKDLDDNLQPTLIGSLRNWPSVQLEGFTRNFEMLLLCWRC